jgi:hypothetical protein
VRDFVSDGLEKGVVLSGAMVADGGGAGVGEGEGGVSLC